MTPELLSRIDALFTEPEGPAAPGWAVGVLQAGVPLMLRGYGLASLSQRTAMRGETLMRIASVSKQFTVAAALVLERQGLLHREDDIRSHLPELTGLPSAVTIEQLMRNCSGLPDMLELLRLGGVNLDQRIDRAQLLEVMARCRHLNFAPGSRFLYSNSGFALLGLICERRSGLSLDALLQQQFFAPLGMTQTRMLVDSDLPLPGLASPYLREDGGPWRRAQHGFEHGGEGGLVSNAPDLLRWAAHLLRPMAGVPDVGSALMALAPLHGGLGSPYAMGLEHSRLDGADAGHPGLEGVGHGGLWPGYRSEFLLLPRVGLALVVLCNDGSLNPYRKARELARLLLDLPAPTAQPDAALAGRWLAAEAGESLELSLREDRDGRGLVARQWGVSFELEARADGSWTPWRGAYEFRLLGLQGDRLELELGGARRLSLSREAAAPDLPPDLAGRYHSEDIATLWRIEADPAGGPATARLWVEGPLHKPPRPWTLRALAADLFELRAPGYWMTGVQLLRLERDAAGRPSALRVDSARVKGLRFDRLD